MKVKNRDAPDYTRKISLEPSLPVMGVVDAKKGIGVFIGKEQQGQTAILSRLLSG